jgi:predicted nucleic acid-binding protein
VIAYFDTSAVVPLLVAEAGSTRAVSLWAGADRVVSARLTYPEARAALAQAQRLGRLTTRDLRVVVRELDVRFAQIDVIEIDAHIAQRAGELAEAHGLRGYDAVHLSAADRVRDPDLVIVAGDGALLHAAHAQGIAVASVA